MTLVITDGEFWWAGGVSIGYVTCCFIIFNFQFKFYFGPIVGPKRKCQVFLQGRGGYSRSFFVCEISILLSFSLLCI